MPGFGIGELALIFLIVVLIFGATRLPQLGKGLGEGISNFKSGLKSRDKEVEPEPDEKKTS